MRQTIEQTTEAPKLSSSVFPLFQWKSFFLFCAISSLIIFYITSSSDVFQVPPEVQQAYSNFKQALQQYEANPLYWDVKQRHVIDEIKQDIQRTGRINDTIYLLQEMSGELLISYLLKELKIPQERLKTIAIFPKTDGTGLSFLISKLEQGVWPLDVILSLELEVIIEQGKVQLLFQRLRRGSQELATGLTWAYFGSDLDWLRQEGVSTMRASQGHIF